MFRKIRKPLSLLILFTCCVAVADPSHQTQSRHALLKKSVLENGLPLIYEWDDSSRTTVVQIFIRGGQRGEPEGKAGLAYLTTRLVLEIPDQKKTQDLMNQATRIYMACREDFSHITLSCLSENLKDAFEVMSKIFSKPLFSGIRIDRLKEQMERQQRRESDESFNQAHATYKKTFFNDSPYAYSFYGDEGSRRAIDKQDIQLFFQNFFRSENMVAVVSSDLSEDEIKILLNAGLGVFPEGARFEPSPIELKPEISETVAIPKDTQQSFVSAGYYIDRSSPLNYIHALLVDNLLGKGINSRLWDLRMKDKLAYNVNSRFTYTQKGILLEVFLETESIKQEAAQEALIQALNALYVEGIDEDELNITKTFAKSQLLRDDETKESRTRTMAFFEVLGLGYDFMEKIFTHIEATTTKELNTFIKTYLNPEKALLVVIGPST